VRLPARTGYLFAQAGVDPASAGPVEIVARSSRRLRDLIRHWWTLLEPEVNAGVVVPMMEEALAAFAERAAKTRGRTFSKKWALAWFDWKPRLLQTHNEQAVGERFVLAMERLGVLVRRGSSDLAFSHESLHELYLGLAFLTNNTLPGVVTAGPRLALEPLKVPEGRAVIARLNLTPAEGRAAALADVARRKLHVAAWFLWGDDEARAEHGAWLAAEMLGEFQWAQRNAERQSLESALASLGAAALPACRALIDARQANLPAYLAAINFVERHGDSSDLPRLQQMAGEPYPGQWEIDVLRQLLRDAEAKVVDPAARERYSRQEAGQMAKETAALALKIAGAVASEVNEPFPVGQNTVLHVAGGLLDGVGDAVMEVSPSEFYETQRALRTLLAHLPSVIERRKVEIYRMAPHVRAAAEAAIRALA